ncbi:MAG: hypothetical protein RL324_2522 [Verrucomicrobiota bacterium]
MSAEPFGDREGETIGEVYAAARKRAERRLFWKGLYPHAVPLAPFLMILRPGHFNADRELIHGLANATSPQQFREEISDYLLNPVNSGWLRGQFRLRVSTRRVERFARLCLGPDTPLPQDRRSRRAAEAPLPRKGRAKDQ